MAPKSSKRQRKQKDRVSLKGKQRALGQTLLDDDNEFDANAFILPTVRPDGQDPNADAPPAAPQLSKSQQRKLRRIQEEKERREKRAEVIATLSKHQLGGDQLGLLRSASSRGQKESKKEALRRALQLQRAGIDLPADSQLFRDRRRSGANAAAADNSDGDDGSGSDSESGSDGEPAPEPAQKRGGAAPMGKWNEKPAPQPSSSDDESSSGGDDSGDEGAPRAKRLKKSDTLEAAAAAAGVSAETLRDAARAARAELEADGMAIDDDDGGAAAPRPASVPVQSGPARVVLVQRTPEIEDVRTNLPILGMEQEVMEAIAQNDVIVLCGETGCGKTTQVPQFLYEAGYGCSRFPERAGAVGVTQPRRVAAAATAARVADELGSRLGDVVGYQVRYDRRVGANTALKFMTDGILLREVQEDFLLRRYSAIVVDEAHERSLNTDILLGMLSRIVALRRSMATQQTDADADADADAVHPLKLIIMSATLRTEDFVANTRLFPLPPPVVNVPARQYPVTVHFSRRTEMYDYVGAAHKKVAQIHRQLPPGGILVFVTGQREVEHLCRKLRRTFAPRKRGDGGGGGGGKEEEKEKEEAAEEGGWGEGGGDAAEADAGAAEEEAMLLAALEDERGGGGDDDFDAVAGSDDESGDEEEVVILGGEGFTPEQIAEAERKFDEQQGALTAAAAAAAGGLAADADPERAVPVHVLPLYAMLPSAAQARVFKPPPPGHRLIIVATNVAETSLTIPGIRYVVDAGRSKQRLLENTSGLSRFEVRWVSKASAEQRAGRAGRTGPGHCYRLYSSAHYSDTFPQHTPPEIINTALEGVALSLKALGVERVPNFPFPTPPEPAALAAAERCLVAMGALEPDGGRLTKMGAAMARYPISPRHARMLLEAVRAVEAAAAAADGDGDGAEGKKKKGKKKRKSASAGEVLAYAVALAAVLSVESPFLSVTNIGGGGEAEEGAEVTMEEAARIEAGRQERDRARGAHARLKVPDSDALSALVALTAFEAAGEDEAFCRSNFLLYKNLREAAALRKQLARLVATGPGSGALAGAAALVRGAPPPSPPPTPALEALRRALAAGWCDQVARRVRSLDHVREAAGGGKKGRAVRYRTCGALEEDVYLHPNSALYSTAPEFVVYSEVVRTTKRPYMAGLTGIEPQWLPTASTALTTLSTPLTDPPPFYSPGSDVVMCWHDASYGTHGWQLPRHAGRHPDGTERAAVFAAALLEGRVLPGMAALRSVMAVPPSMAAKPEMRVHRRVADLVAALAAAGVDSKASLAAAWKKNPGFLKGELEAWMQKGGEVRLRAAWPDLVAESVVPL